MKIPKTINILGKKYKIKLLSDFNYVGLCDSETSTIYLNANQKDEDMLCTILHELIHAWQFRVGLNQAISKESLEVISEGISIVLCEVFDIKFKKP